MKKIIMSILLISTISVLTGCSNKEVVIQEDEGTITETTEFYTERTAKDAKGNKVVTKRFNNGHIEQEIHEGNKITRINKHPNGHTDKMIEETTKDTKGNKVIKRVFHDGSLEKEVHEGNKIIRTHKHHDGKTDKSIEETLSDGTRIMTHHDPEGRIHKFTEKDLGNGKRKILIENQQEDGTIERIEEEHEDLGDGIHKMIQNFQDGKVQEMIMTHNNKEDKNETTITYPDGRVEKTIEQFIRQSDGKTKIITTHPDGSTSERNI